MVSYHSGTGTCHASKILILMCLNYLPIKNNFIYYNLIKNRPFIANSMDTVRMKNVLKKLKNLILYDISNI
jgi:hypothetical protein